MVKVAQLVEHRVVVPRVMGSIPIFHPNLAPVRLGPNKGKNMQLYYNIEIIAGVLFLLWGITTIIKIIWGIDIPIFKAILAMGLVYLGITLLVRQKNSYFYHKNTYTYTLEPFK